MKVNVLVKDDEMRERHRNDLERFLAQTLDDKQRPCPGCKVPCPCSASPTCACACSAACASCPAEMSSEPERYPIETNILELVYAFYTSRVCLPCWSCEGHTSGDGGTMVKPPRVWFYSHSVVYPKLIAQYIDELRFRKEISHPWRVGVLSWGEGNDTRFDIEPTEIVGHANVLGDLQQDARVIARTLKPSMRSRANEALERF